MTNDVENVSNSVSQSLGSLISGVIMLVGCFVLADDAGKHGDYRADAGSY